MTGFTRFAVLAVTLVAGLEPRVSFRTLAEIDYTPAKEFAEFHASLATTAQSTFLATPGGLYRLPRRVEDGSASLMSFGVTPISRVYADETGRVFVLKESAVTPGAATDHALLRSADGGETFVPIDEGLSWCYQGDCQFMMGSELTADGDVLYYAAGGNVVASNDGGATWQALVGFLEPAFCYDPSIELVGERLLIGGECPLDVAYVRAGTLAPDRISWLAEPESVATPYLENRNVQFIRRLAGTDIVFAGIEGALLRSFDGGHSFDFAIHIPLAGHEKYPYIGSLWAPQTANGTILVGGFDKAVETDAAWLALSRDFGRTWTDVSDLIPRDAGFSPYSVSFLEEDRDGRILAGVVDTTASKMRIAEVTIHDARRRLLAR